MLEKPIDEYIQPNGLATNYLRQRAESKVTEILRQNNSIGRITWSANGGPLRTIVTGTKPRRTGVYQSVKTRQAQAYESLMELAHMKLCEADYEVRYWLAQPHRLEMFVNKETLTYFPDAMTMDESGRCEVIEVKRDKVRDVNEYYRAKISLAKIYYEILGFDFRIVDRSDLLREPRYANSVEIVRHSHTSFSEAELFSVIDWMVAQRGRPVSFGQLAKLLGGGIIGKKKLCAMLVRRKLRIDLDAPLSDDALISMPVEGGGFYDF